MRTLLLTVALISCRKATPPEAPVALAVVPHPQITDIAMGSQHGCAVVAGRVACWGDGLEGQLGGPVDSTRGALVDGLSDVVQIEAASATTCARRSGGEVWCWGDNDGRQVTREPGEVPCPTRIDEPPARDIVVGSEVTCFDTDEGWWCSGGFRSLYNARPGGDRFALEPGPEPALGAPASVSLGWSTCVVVDQTGWCWGQEGFRGLEEAPAPWPEGPQDAWRTPEANVESVVTQDRRVAFTRADGLLLLTSRDEPREVPWPGVRDVAYTSTGACLLDVAGRVACWEKDEPPAVVIEGATAIAAATSTACALTAEGVRCWGDDARGTVGDGGDSAWEPHPVGAAAESAAPGPNGTCLGPSPWRCFFEDAWRDVAWPPVVDVRGRYALDDDGDLHLLGVPGPPAHVRVASEVTAFATHGSRVCAVREGGCTAVDRSGTPSRSSRSTGCRRA